MERFLPSRPGKLATLKSLELSILCNSVTRGIWNDSLSCRWYFGAAIATLGIINHAVVGKTPMNAPSSSEHGTTTVATLSARMAWMIVGPMILTITGLNISFSGGGWGTLLDGVFLCVVGIMLAARWYELASGEGRDSYGEPDTTASYPRFVWTFAPMAIAAWVFVNIIGNYVMN